MSKYCAPQGTIIPYDPSCRAVHSAAQLAVVVGSVGARNPAHRQVLATPDDRVRVPDLKWADLGAEPVPNRHFPQFR